MGNVQKASAISDAKIQFVSLVDKAANKRRFLVAKQEGGQTQFSTYSRILKVDAETHYITGVVYEPMTEDAHGNYMTADEIRKAAYWFSKHGDEVDLQHSFESADGLSVVENYVAPCNLTIGDTPVVKGTWIITVECSNEAVWQAVQKGELTGFSMGGVGKYSEEEVDLDNIEKTGADTAGEEKSLFKRLAKLFGFDLVEKGEVMDRFKTNAKADQFWNAMWTLEDVLYRYNWPNDRYEFISDEATIREALEDFGKIITQILTDPDTPIVKAVSLPVAKAGKKMSGANKQKLDAIYQALSDFKASFDESEGDEGDREGGESITKNEEENDMTREETVALVHETVGEAITKALTDAGVIKPANATENTVNTVEKAAPASTDAPAAPDLDNKIEAAVNKALVAAGIIEPEVDTSAPVTKADIEQIVKEAMTPVLRAFGMPQNLNGAQSVEKTEEQHYLHGIL